MNYMETVDPRPAYSGTGRYFFIPPSMPYVNPVILSALKYLMAY